MAANSAASSSQVHHLLPLLLVLLVVPSSLAQSRTFNLVNHCTDTVWFTVTSGAVASISGSACTVDTDCVEGTSCQVNNGICYWTVPTPGRGNFRLEPNGGTNTVTFDFYSNGQSVVWSGNIGGCLNGTCSASASSCDATGCGTTGGSPQTLAEFTLSTTGQDYYDVEVINGFNLPVAVYPQLTTTPSSTTPYTCGSPGSPQSLTGTANCTWKFTPPSIYYNWVQTGGASCSALSDCSGYPGTVCGLSNNIGHSPRFQLTCGALLGYWTANQVCGVDNTVSFFNCTQALTSPDAGDTLWNLYACNNDIPSCYQNGASSGCCGCADWETLGLSVPASTQSCVSANPTWTSEVLPGLKWIKAACPSVYTYPFDDMSSTFVCSSIKSGNNVLSYSITWCPQSDVPTDSTGPSGPSATATPTSKSSAALLIPSSLVSLALFMLLFVVY